MKTPSATTKLSMAFLAAVLCVLPAAAEVRDLYPTDDAMLDQQDPDTALGSSTELWVRNNDNGVQTDLEMSFVVRFDLSDAMPGTVGNAILYVYYYDWENNNPAYRQLTCRRITSDWDEDTVTWNTQPERAAEVTDLGSISGSPGTWRAWGVLDDVQDFIDGAETDYGWIITDEVVWGAPGIPIIKFHSKEYGSFEPYLYLSGVDFDCNSNGIADADDLAAGTSVDCNNDDIPDECQLVDNDCNTNGVPDDCDLAGGTSEDCNTDDIPDECNIAAGTSGDCNTNGVPDECDMTGGTSADCNFDGVPDECNIAAGTSGDCNTNGVPDECDIFAGTSEDCDGNMVPDECSGDCNTNGVLDARDICFGTSQDCNFDFVPDECNIAAGASGDCNTNGVPDECDLAAGTSGDCNSDGVPDECSGDCNTNGILDAWDICYGPSQDCNGNAVPDECESQEDCQTNGFLDICDLAAGTSADCNANRVPDECESQADCQPNGSLDFCDLAGGTSEDCNANGVPDECEPQEDCQPNGMQDICDLAGGTSQDCNANDVPDECDVFGGTSEDCNGDLVPDECSGDCNANGVLDAWDICFGTSEDCNFNVVPDECEPQADCQPNGIQDICDIAAGTSADCNGDGVPDECSGDCNGNGVLDARDICSGTSQDCNHDGVPDECSDDCNMNAIPDASDICYGTSEDCNDDGVPDECSDDCNFNGEPDASDICYGTSEDCNHNVVPDECDVVGGTSGDCDNNGVPDECEPGCNDNGVPDACDIAGGTSSDCNDNDVPDECDIGGGTSADVNTNGVPDECDPRSYYVDDSAVAGANDGSSWDDAFTKLQSALTLAEGGDEIRVAQGTYRPDEDAANTNGTGDRTASFRLLDAVAMYGGHAGTGAADPDERNVVVYETVLSGDLDLDDVGTTGRAENSYHVVWAGKNITPDSLLDGFTISGGNADGLFPDYRGGGMYNSNGSPTLADCTFSGNSVSAQGGGMYNWFASPTLTNCAFSGNSAGSLGGGMLNFISSRPTLTNCTLSGNTAGSSGGGIACGGPGGVPTLTNCILWGNVAPSSPQISGPATIMYSDIEGGWAGTGSNNIDADPLFVAGPSRCFYLSQTAAGQPNDSPCVDAGSNGVFDPAGRTTRRDEGPDTGDVDMGYHYPVTGEPFVRGDFDRDGDVDLDDYAEFSACMTGPCASASCAPFLYDAPCCSIGDFNDDGDVDLADFGLLQQEFIASGAPSGMVLIPGGAFEMGCRVGTGVTCYADEVPLHDVSVDSFYMDIYEVTNQQYCTYLNSAYGQGLIDVGTDGVVYKAGDTEAYCNTYSVDAESRIHWDGNTFTITAGKEDHPMVEVSWYGAVAYTNWRSQQDGRTPCYDLSAWTCDFDANGYRLPTEAEWEYAARGGHHDPYYLFPWGNTIAGRHANYWYSGDDYETTGNPRTTPVGYYDGGQQPPGGDMANGYGLYDVAGNALEWCYDWHGEDYYYDSPENNPQGPTTGTLRVLRGGAWSAGHAYRMTCGHRLKHLPERCGHAMGFRVALGT